jgi:predicted nuclease of restriction endonuclease-like (RecB) superfamily
MGDSLVSNSAISFDEVIAIIDNARENAFRAVNRELIDMYWNIGEYVSRRAAEGGWGKGVVKEFSDFIQSRYIGIKGFSPQNIWRMKQFYETYRDSEKLSTLLREITWSHNLQILSCKTDEE